MAILDVLSSETPTGKPNITQTAQIRGLDLLGVLFSPIVIITTQYLSTQVLTIERFHI